MNGDYEQYVKDCIKEGKKHLCYDEWKRSIDKVNELLKRFPSMTFKGAVRL